LAALLSYGSVAAKRQDNMSNFLGLKADLLARTAGSDLVDPDGLFWPMFCFLN
jgi:hypothetical protein